MGLFRRGIKDGVAGEARVVSASSPHGQRGGAALKMCTVNLVVTAGDIPPFAVEHTQLCSTKRWPHAGTVVPVVVSRSDPGRYELDFDAVPKHADVARSRAEQQAAALRGEAPAGGAFAGGAFAGANVQFVGGSPADLPPDKRAKLERLLGVDLDGDGVIGEASPPPPPPPAPPPAAAGSGGGEPPTDLRLEQLERLVRLRDAGALTEAEFAAEKARLLGS